MAIAAIQWAVNPDAAAGNDGIYGLATQTATLDAVPTAGNLLVAYVASRPASASGNPPTLAVASGGNPWTSAGAQPASSNHRGGMFYRQAEAGEAAAVDLTCTHETDSTFSAVIVVVEFDFAGTLADYSSAENLGSTSSIAAGAVTTTAGDLLTSLGSIRANNTTALTNSAGLTNQPQYVPDGRYMFRSGHSEAAGGTVDVTWSAQNNVKASAFAISAVFTPGGGGDPVAVTATISGSDANDSGTFAATHTAPQATAALAGTDESDVGTVTATHAAPVTTGLLAGSDADDTGTLTVDHTAPTYTATIAGTDADDDGTLVASHVEPSFAVTVAGADEADTGSATATHTAPTFSAVLAGFDADDSGTLVASTAAPQTGITISGTDEADTGAIVAEHVGPVSSVTLSGADDDDTGTVSASFQPAGAAWISGTDETDTGQIDATHVAPTFEAIVAGFDADDAGTLTADATPPTHTATLSGADDDDAGAFAVTVYVPTPSAGAIAGTDDDDFGAIIARSYPDGIPLYTLDGPRSVRFTDAARAVEWSDEGRTLAFVGAPRGVEFTDADRSVDWTDPARLIEWETT